MQSTHTTQQSTDADTKIRVDDVTKRFGRLTAVDSVSLSIYPGEIFAVVGDNGAGKSTLMNVICGVYPPTSGRVYVEGEPVSFSNPSDARDRGIETVYQDLELMDDLDVATNIFIGRFPTHASLGPLKIIDWETAYDRAEEILDDLGQDLDPTSEVEFLSGGERQLVAVARSITFDPDVLILDEPTSALSFAGAELVHETMERLKGEGRTQIVISHDIAEVYRLADRIGVMYQGSIVDVVDPDEVPRDEVESLIKTGQRDQ